MDGVAMNRGLRRARWRAATAVGLAAVLAACSSGPGGGGGADAGEAASLTVATPLAISSLDPHGAASGDRPTIMVAQHVYDSLVVREGSEFVPSLATEWTNEDDLTWRFSLHEDAVFHDGAPVTADDVVASYERLVEQGGPLSSQWAAVESFTAEDEHTVLITTERPLGTLLSNLALLFVVPADKADEQDFFLDPVGSGPFQVDEFRLNDRLVLTANEDYWGGPPEVDELVIRDMPEASSVVAALETGEVDVSWGLPADQITALASNEDLTVETLPSFVYYMNWFNSSREPFTDVRVRQAMAHALDVDRLVSELMPDAAAVATAPIPSTVFGHSPQEPWEHDPERAKALLAEAGYPDGIQVTLDISTGGGPQIREIAQTMISDWKAAGIEVTLQEKERAVWLEDLLALEWDMNLLVNSVLTGDADFTLGRLYPSSANRTGYANPELDELLLQASSTLDQDERAELYAEADRIIWEDVVGVFPMELLANYVWRDGVTGLELDPNETPNFTRVGIE